MAVVIPAVQAHQATLIFLHGLGDTAQGWAPVMRMLSRRLPTLKFVLPTAPSQPVSLNNHAVMPAWYDIYSLNGDERRVDVEGVKKSVTLVQSLVEREPGGVKVIVGGFSQGGCIALATACSQSADTWVRPVDGCVSLSGYFADKVYHDVGNIKSIPIFMGHGHADPVVSHQWSLQSAKKIKQLGFTNLSYHDYAGLQHGASDQELDDMVAFISALIDTDHKEL